MSIVLNMEEWKLRADLRSLLRRKIWLDIFIYQVFLLCVFVMIINVSLVASQMWNFAVTLPLLIGDKVDEDDSKWKCFLYLLEITKICTAHITSLELADYVRVLILEHHRLFKSCYPDVSLIPKMHYMVHFPRLLTR